ncbi:xaa-Pro aminopeptidase 2 [Pelobates cultripes]|uniref:Xaa-Pro aminopeptidase 2 n=2 Tax=Pelobates cultripes TaxID=61616 RepID=A0AAD1WNC0_PELCU|nr:xaa-Pro aminopeptidase 2 [Pelobates cultripes]
MEDEVFPRSLERFGHNMAACRWLLGTWIVIQYGCAVGYPKANRDSTMRDCSKTPPYLPATVKISTEDLHNIRQEMQAQNISAYIIPATDAHLGEYTAPREKRRQWLSGFTGSSGTAVVTSSRAAVFTDSRYWTQAERQMDCNWELQRTISSGDIVAWIFSEVSSGQQIGFDPFLFSIDEWTRYNNLIKDSGRILHSIPDNLVDKVWGSQRPSLPNSEIYSLPNDFVGDTWQQKVENIRDQMKKHAQKPTAVLLSALEETAWLFNLRAQDIPFNPYFYSYALLAEDSISLFVNNMSRITPELSTYLNTNCPQSTCVKVLDYNQVRESVIDYVKGNVIVWIGTKYTNYGLYEIIPKEKLLAEEYSPAMITKAVKNKKEQELLKNCHIRDAVAVIQYMIWLEKTVPSGTVNENNAGDYVDSLRTKQAYFKGPSFETISASGLNAALPHYRASNETNRGLTINEMYLVDSGGQYLDGTTDITRTVHWGKPSDFEKEAYTRVLIGNLELSMLVFPSATSGRVIESFARRALWEIGLNYGHGTGHGIGNFFSVHEWPAGFQSTNIPLREGMFTSIEPGYYQEGDFGIRIEDIVVVVEAKTEHTFENQKYLTFETVSLVPYDKNLIDTKLMTEIQINHVNNHYKKIRDILGKELKKQNLNEEYTWLEKNTEPLSHGQFVTASLTLLIVTFASCMFFQNESI